MVTRTHLLPMPTVSACNDEVLGGVIKLGGPKVVSISKSTEHLSRRGFGYGISIRTLPFPMLAWIHVHQV